MKNTSLNAEMKYWDDKLISPKYLDLKYLSNDDFINKTICEIGCGASAYIFTIKNAKKKIGVDPLMDYYIEKKKIKNTDPTLKLINSPAESMGMVQSDSCDFVFALNMLDHVQYPRKVINECYRILKMDGILYIECNLVSKLLYPIRKFLKYIDIPHPHHFIINDLKRILEENNFSIVFQEIKKMKTFNYSFKAKIGSRLMKQCVIVLEKKKKSSN